MALNKSTAALMRRKYKQTPGGKMLTAICNQTGLKIGSGICTSECIFFHSIDYDIKTVTCYDPNKK
jgi:hypothetical protein